MFTTFLFPFANFFQPGVFMPQLADFRPMQIIAVLALLGSIGSKSSFNRMDAVRHPAIKWLFFFLFVQVLSLYRAGFSSMLAEAGFWITYALFVLVSLRLISDPAHLRRYIWGMLIGSAWIVGFGIFAVFAGLETVSNGGRAGAYGMYENHNDYSFIVVQTLPFFFVYWRTESGFIRRLFLLLATLACVVGIFMSLSRGGMMALVLEVVLLVLFTAKKRKTKLWLLPLVLALGAAAISYQYIKRAQNQGDSYTAEDAESSRYELWEAGGAMFRTHPFLGIGSRTFGEYATDYAEISHDNLGKNAHNTYIEAAATTGLFGLVALVMMLRLALRDLRIPANGFATPWEESTRVATLIALYTLCFRSLFDAKSWDWSFYVLITIAAATSAIIKSRREAAPVPVEPSAVQVLPDRPFSNILP